MLSIKFDFNLSQNSFDQIMQLMIETSLSNNIPPNFYEKKKLVNKLGLRHEKIDCCMKWCMLFYNEARFDRECRICDSPQYKE